MRRSLKSSETGSSQLKRIISQVFHTCLTGFSCTGFGGGVSNDIVTGPSF